MNTNISKWIEFGLFGPQITYYKTGYFRPNAQLVISLLFAKLYTTFAWCHAEVNEEKVYGFYFESDPSRFLFIWGGYHKNIIMPWSRVVIDREFIAEINLNEYTYKLTRLTSSPKCFKRLKRFNKKSYEINVKLNKPRNGYSQLSFITNTMIGIQEQINVQLAATDKNPY